jgi:ferredoxin-NADP reductase
VPALTGCEVFLCGPSGLNAVLARELRDAGVPRRQIHRESFEF